MKKCACGNFMEGVGIFLVIIFCITGFLTTAHWVVSGVCDIQEKLDAIKPYEISENERWRDRTDNRISQLNFWINNLMEEKESRKK